jgi:steroid 5-alpha reductase family enzyme
LGIDYGPPGAPADTSALQAAIDASLQQPLAVNHLEDFRSRLADTEQVLYLADNAGETVFDRVLIETLSDCHKNIFFRDAKTTVRPFQESAALVTDGAYRISRHPMYLGFVLILLGPAVLLGSLTPFFVVPIFAVVMDRVFIVVEERMLAEEFGQAWLSYKAKVRRWV